MKAVVAVLLLWLLAVTKRQIVAREGSIAVNCRQDVVTVQILAIERLVRRMNATAFLVGDLNGRSCTVSQEYRTIELRYPFRMCGTKVALSSEGVVFSNTVWLWTTAGIPVKFADVECRYGAHFEDVSEPQRIALENRLSGALRPEVGLCQTPMYCPRRACPSSESLDGRVIYFQGDVMHLSIRLTGMEAGLKKRNEWVGATITRLVVSCGANPLRGTEEYYSVQHGCRAYGNSYEDRRKALYTQVEYNVQSDTICMSVDTPPPNGCTTFYLHGTAIRCNKTYEKKCDDFSGSRCNSPGATKSDFVYGPIYVFNGSRTEAIVTYYAESTTPITPTSNGDLVDDVHGKSAVAESGVDVVAKSISPNFDIDNTDIDSYVPPKYSRNHESRSRPNIPRNTAAKRKPPMQVVVPSEIPPNVDFDRIVPSTTSRNTALIATLKRPNVPRGSNSHLPRFNEIIDLEEIAEEKALNDPIFGIGSPSATTGSSPKELSGKSADSKKSSKKKPQKKKPHGKITKVDQTLKHNDPPVSDPELRVEQAILDTIDDADRFPSFRNKSVVTDARKTLTDKDSPSSANQQEASLEQPPLGVYKAQAGNDGFIWGTVSALGVFLLASIGLLVAWTVTKRKKTRRLKRRRIL